MQSNPMELIETSWVGRDQVKLSSEEESTWRPPTCVITHWKQMTNVNVFTNVIQLKSLPKTFEHPNDIGSQFELVQGGTC